MKLYIYLATIISLASSCIAMTPVTITNAPFSVELIVQPICGQSAPFDTVTVSIFNNLTIGTAIADENGLWTFVAPSTQFVFSATSFNANNIDTQASNPQTLQANVVQVDGNCTGASLQIPSITTQEVFYQISIAGTRSFSGTAPAGQRIQLNINNTFLPYILIDVDANGNWVYDLADNGGFNTIITATSSDGTQATARLSMGLNVLPFTDPAAFEAAESNISSAIIAKFCPEESL